MKSVLYAAAALLVATAAAHAGPVSDRAGPKAPELGDRAAYTTEDRMPVGLERDVFLDPANSLAGESGRSAREWTGNDNEG